MLKLIELNQGNGKKVFINYEHIVFIIEVEHHTINCEVVTTRSNHIPVVESSKMIFKKIENILVK